MAALVSKSYGETVEKLKADPTIQVMADELSTALCGGAVKPEQLIHPDGTATHDFMGRALDEWNRRTTRPVSTHIGGPAEAILAILGYGA